MALRPRRHNVVILSSSRVPDTRSWAWRPARPRRIRWWLRTGTLLALIGLVRLTRTARTRWEPVSLVAGVTITVVGYEVPAASWAFLLGIGVLVITLLKGIAAKGRAASQAADCWQWRG